MPDLITTFDSYDAFRAHVRTLLGTEHTSGRGKTHFLNDIDIDSAYGNPLVARWTTGGMSGGNCWGDDANYSVTPEDEPEDEALDKILESVCPNLTFLQYRKLLKASVYDRDTDNQYEYYGNYTTYGTRKLCLDRVYTALKEITG